MDNASRELDREMGVSVGLIFSPMLKCYFRRCTLPRFSMGVQYTSLNVRVQPLGYTCYTLPSFAMGAQYTSLNVRTQPLGYTQREGFVICVVISMKEKYRMVFTLLDMFIKL